MKRFIRVMKALSDPSRVKVIKMLHVRHMCVCEIRAALGLAQPTVSSHLKVLEEAGLVVSFREGQWVNYALAVPETPHGKAMIEGVSVWLDDDPEIVRLMESLSGIHRELLCDARAAGANAKEMSS
jgi:ArsR family transcriptional regulator, arsenate/arsenite/antimonite-responsive transcriptional repressor